MGHRSSLSACPPQKNEPPQNRFRKFAANANAGVAANVIDAHEDQAKRQSPASDKTENGKTQNEAAPGSCKTVVWLCWPFSCSFASCMCFPSCSFNNSDKNVNSLLWQRRVAVQRCSVDVAVATLALLLLASHFFHFFLYFYFFTFFQRLNCMQFFTVFSVDCHASMEFQFDFKFELLSIVVVYVFRCRRRCCCCCYYCR